MSKGAYEYVDLGVVLEKREVDNRWVDHVWQPIGVLPGAPEMDSKGEWRCLWRGEGIEHWHAGTLRLELFEGETTGYKVNLANHAPHVYVVLMPGSEADEPELYPHVITVCPYEAEGYTEDSDQLVEGVPMPPEVAVWVKEFCDRFHKEVEFKKRKRKKAYDPRKEGFGPMRDGKGGGSIDG